MSALHARYLLGAVGNNNHRRQGLVVHSGMKHSLNSVCVLAILACGWRGAVVPADAGDTGRGFIRTAGTRFVDDQCKDFIFTGSNMYVHRNLDTIGLPSF